jgi:hypothetical protein
MFQMMGALGAMSVLPQSLAAKPFSTVMDRHIGNLADGTSPNSALDFLEAVEDLEDELDCIELIGRYCKLVKDKSYPIPVWADWPGGRCPFCGFADCWLAVWDHGFNTGCDNHGGGVSWFSLVERIPLPESVRMLRGMLDRGELVGMRKRIEKECILLEDLAGFCHATLVNQSGGAPLGGKLNQLTEETIHRRQIGLISSHTLPSFLSQLRKKGWSQGELLSIAHHVFRGKPAWAALVIPVRDDGKKVLGFAKLDQFGPTHLRDSDLPPRIVFSRQRWDRLFLHNCHAASGIQGAEPLLLTSDPLDAVVLWQEGFVFAVAPVKDWSERNLRRIRALKSRLIYAVSREFFRREAFMLLLSQLGSNVARLYIVELPNGSTVAGYLRTHGAQALRARFDSAVPVSQVLKV